MEAITKSLKGAKALIVVCHRREPDAAADVCRCACIRAQSIMVQSVSKSKQDNLLHLLFAFIA